MNSQNSSPDYKNPRLPVERRVADLLSRMTLEEKTAQLTCLWGGRPQVEPPKNFDTDRGDFSPEKAAEVMKHGIGQIARQREQKDPRQGAMFANAVQKWLCPTRITVKMNYDMITAYAETQQPAWPLRVTSKLSLGGGDCQGGGDISAPTRGGGDQF